MAEKLDSNYIGHLEGLIDSGEVISDKDAKTALNKPWRYGEKNGEYLAAVQVTTEKAMAAVLRYCENENIFVVPRAGGTALTNGSTIDESRPEGTYILLQNAIRKEPEIIEEDSQVYAIIGAGTTAQDIEESSDYIVPVDLGIGGKGGEDKDGEMRHAELLGYLATNAAGSGAAFKGRAADMVKSMKVMTPDGTVWDIPSKVAGAPTMEEIIGFGGTTGMILEAKIKLMEKPKQRAVAALRVDNIGQMHDLLQACKETCWENMNLFERVNGELLDAVVRHHDREERPETEKLKNSGNADYLFLELISNTGDEDLNEILSEVIDKAGLAGREIVAETEEDQDFLLSYRVVNASTSCDRVKKEMQGELVAFDISVPFGDDAEFPSQELIDEIRKEIKGVAILTAGHAAGLVKLDANSPRGGTALHFNIVLPQGQEDKEDWLRNHVFEHVSERGGQIVSEHTVGTKLVKYFKDHMSDAYDATLQTIAKWNPKGFMNAGAFCELSDVIAKGQEKKPDGK